MISCGRKPDWGPRPMKRRTLPTELRDDPLPRTSCERSAAPMMETPPFTARASKLPEEGCFCNCGVCAEATFISAVLQLRTSRRFWLHHIYTLIKICRVVAVIICQLLQERVECRETELREANGERRSLSRDREEWCQTRRSRGIRAAGNLWRVCFFLPEQIFISYSDDTCFTYRKKRTANPFKGSRKYPTSLSLTPGMSRCSSFIPFSGHTTVWFLTVAGWTFHHLVFLQMEISLQGRFSLLHKCFWGVKVKSKRRLEQRPEIVVPLQGCCKDLQP